MIKSVAGIEKNKCTGCGACSNICPVSAITMQADEEGFPYPVVDSAKCTDCGLCLGTCAAHELTVEKNTDKPVCYAMMASNEIREESSSGGMFGLMAQHVLSQKGAVVGCAYNEKLEAEHILITDMDRLPALRHSKYTQSRMGDIYKQTKKFLTDNPDKPLLFTGCPCHVAGLRMYLKKDYPNLITADIICHGIVSPKVFARYIDELSELKGSKLTEITFREKRVFGWTTAVGAKFENGKVYHRGDEDPYLKAYLKNLMSRPSCSGCQFTTISRQGDITIGDFWGITKLDKTMSDTRGTSLVLVNNPKGEKLMSELYDQCRRIREMPLDSALENQAHLHRPASPHPRRDEFFRMLRNNSIEDATEKILNDRYDIGLIGAWYFPNYGTSLTYFALHTVLEEMGYSVLMIDKPVIKENDIERRENYARTFAENHGYAVSEAFDLDNTMALNDLCDIFMLGSDQMWTWSRCNHFGTYYFLDFARDDKKKIVYAGSFGKDDFFAPEEGRARCAYHASRIDAVSLREDQGVEIAKKRFGIDAEFVLDPIFLCDHKHYEALAASSKRPLPEKPYLMTYILDPTEGKRNAVKKTAEVLGLEMVNTLNAVPWLHKENAEKLKLPNIQEDMGLEDMLNYYKNADFILTDSFHGSCFAILFRKPFICISNHQRGIPRFFSLFGLLGLMDRLAYRPGEINMASDDYFHFEIDYDRVYEIIEKERERSFAWLKNALEAEKNTPPSAHDILMREIKRLEKELKEKSEPATEPVEEKSADMEALYDALLRQTKRFEKEIKSLRDGDNK